MAYLRNGGTIIDILKWYNSQPAIM